MTSRGPGSVISGSGATLLVIVTRSMFGPVALTLAMVKVRDPAVSATSTDTSVQLPKVVVLAKGIVVTAAPSSDSVIGRAAPVPSPLA